LSLQVIVLLAANRLVSEAQQRLNLAMGVNLNPRAE
jgi:hypothetical protein